jgi:hypothetical protein
MRLPLKVMVEALLKVMVEAPSEVDG